MADRITVTGIVATIPNFVVTNGLPIASFRIASTHRKFDKDSGSWVDGDTNWFGVVAFRRLAEHLPGSLEKGQHVIISGRLKIRDWVAGEKSGRSVEIEADAIGHDLSWGTAEFTKRAPSAVPEVDPDADAPPVADEERTPTDPVDLADARARREELPVPF